MAERTVKYCDVYGTNAHVAECHVFIVRGAIDLNDPGQLLLNGKRATEDVVVERIASKDLSKRAVKRLKHFIKRGTSPPPPRKPKGAVDANDADFVPADQDVQPQQDQGGALEPGGETQAVPDAGGFPNVASRRRHSTAPPAAGPARPF